MASPGRACLERLNETMPDSPYSRKSTSPASRMTTRPARVSVATQCARRPLRRSRRPGAGAVAATPHSTGESGTSARPSASATAPLAPPLAMTSVAASSSRSSPSHVWDRRTCQPPRCRVAPVTSRPHASAAPARLARASRTFLTLAAWRLRG